MGDGWHYMDYYPVCEVRESDERVFERLVASRLALFFLNFRTRKKSSAPIFNISRLCKKMRTVFAVILHSSI